MVLFRPHIDASKLTDLKNLVKGEDYFTSKEMLLDSLTSLRLRSMRKALGQNFHNAARASDPSKVGQAAGEDLQLTVSVDYHLTNFFH